MDFPCVSLYGNNMYIHVKENQNKITRQGTSFMFIEKNEKKCTLLRFLFVRNSTPTYALCISPQSTF